MNEEEITVWGPALDLGKEGQEKIKGNDLIFYLTKMEQVRNRTLDFFKSVNDDWLYIEERFCITNKQTIILCGFMYLKMKSIIGVKSE